MLNLIVMFCSSDGTREFVRRKHRYVKPKLYLTDMKLQFLTPLIPESKPKPAEVKESPLQGRCVLSSKENFVRIPGWLIFIFSKSISWSH